MSAGVHCVNVSEHSTGYDQNRLRVHLDPQDLRPTVAKLRTYHRIEYV
jgi:hypothetical protein